MSIKFAIPLGQGAVQIRMVQRIYFNSRPAFLVLVIDVFFLRPWFTIPIAANGVIARVVSAWRHHSAVRWVCRLLFSLFVQKSECHTGIDLNVVAPQYLNNG